MEDITNVEATDAAQQEQQTEAPQPSIATIAAVYEDGVTLLFDGEEAPGEKHYKCNTSVVFAAGDRVKIAADSGTFVAEYVVGSPKQGGEVTGIPAGGAEGRVLRKRSATDYDVAWSSKGLVPAGGSAGQVLSKSSGSDYALTWATISGTLPSGGSSGQYLYKASSSNYAVGWTDAPTAEKLVNGNYSLELSSSGLLSNGSKYYPLTLGNATYPLTSIYTNGGTFGSSDGKIGFYGTTAIARQTLSTTSNNMGYSSATSSNYLYVLNNVVGILKKLGLMK